MLSSLNIFHKKPKVEIDDTELKSRRTFQLHQTISSVVKASNGVLSSRQHHAAAKSVKVLLTDILPTIKAMIATYETDRKEIPVMKTYFDEYQVLEKAYQLALKDYERIQKEDVDGQAYYENKKRELREKITELQGDETRKIALMMAERNARISQLTQDRVKQTEDIHYIKSSPNGCCGSLSKSQIKKISQLRDEVDHLESDIKSVIGEMSSFDDVQDHELTSLKEKLKKVRLDLKEHLESYPAKIATAKQRLDDAECALREKETMLFQFKNVFYAGIPNQLMFHLLRMYVLFFDLKKMVMLLDAKSQDMLSLKEMFNLKNNYAEQLLKSLWCPNSKDRSGSKFIEMLFPADPTKANEDLLRLIRDINQVSDEAINKLVPSLPGRLFKRLEDGRLDGVPPNFIHLQTDTPADTIAVALPKLGR